jgi:hypothetical protein
MEQVVLVCDVCGRQKGATNHWYVAVTDPATHDRPGSEGIAFGPIDAETFDRDTKREHICGQECLHKRLAQWLETA